MTGQEVKGYGVGLKTGLQPKNKKIKNYKLVQAVETFAKRQ